MKLRTLGGALLTVACSATAAWADGLPSAAKPEDVGFSSERLKRLTAAVRADVDKGLLPGAVILIARNGKVAYHEAIGFQDREQRLPMKADAIFRIASLTKPITAVAIMMLVEEGRIQLEDAVAVYLPELKNLQVGDWHESTLGSIESNRQRAQPLEATHEMISGLSAEGFGDAAGHHVSAGGNDLLASRQQIGKHRETQHGVSQNSSTCPERQALAIFFHDDTQRPQIQVLHAARSAADDMPRRRAIVGNDTGKIEFEVAVARVDDFQRRHDELHGGQCPGDRASRTAQFAPGHQRDLRLDPRMDQLGDRQL